MIKTGNEEVDEKIEALYDMGQDHIFLFWDDLDSTQQNVLVEQIKTIDIDLMQTLIREHVLSEQKEEAEVDIEPVPIIDRENHPERDKAFYKGEELLYNGKVCAFLVAGGQGTRLGYDGPKGSFPVGPVSDRSLFRIHAEKIMSASRKYDSVIPWYIMTSEVNDKPTKDFFNEKDFFGLDPDNVMFFTQDMIPAVDKEGKFFLASKNTIFRSPNGHGGSLQALFSSGALEDMEERDIDVISYFQVDNPLVRIIDPVFIGFHSLNKAQMSSKVIEKRDAEEKVGVIGYCNGDLGVIEYSDMPEEQKYATNKDGSLKYSAGSIAIHIIQRDFVKEINKGGFQLPYHRADKKVSYVNEKSEQVEPDTENGVKFETFVFDALAMTDSSVTLRTRREDEFSPVKNAEGLDSPETARRDMSRLYKKWLSKAGFTGDLPGTVEISPQYANSPEDLQDKLKGNILYS